MSKQEGRRKAREAGKEECVNDQQFKMDEFKVRQALEMARADLCFAVNYGDMPQSYCMRLGSTVEYITEVLGDHDEFTKLFGEWKTI